MAKEITKHPPCGCKHPYSMNTGGLDHLILVHFLTLFFCNLVELKKNEKGGFYNSI